jgi:hypothetical protein
MSQVAAKLADIGRQLDVVRADHDGSLTRHNNTSDYIEQQVLTLGVRIGRVTNQVAAAVSTTELGSGTVKLSDRFDVFSTDDLELVVFNISAKIYTVGTLVAVVRIGTDFFVCSDPGVFANQTITLTFPDVLRASILGSDLSGLIEDDLGESDYTVLFETGSSIITVDQLNGGADDVVVTGNNSSIVTLVGPLSQINVLLTVGPGGGDSITHTADLGGIFYAAPVLAQVTVTATAADGRTATLTIPSLIGEQWEFLNEEDLASDDPTAVPSQHSVKAYVDAGDAVTLAASEAYTDAAVAGAGSSTVDTQFYTTSGSPHTWTKPAGAKVVEIHMLGGGGGGGSGSKEATGSDKDGGSGGGGAAAAYAVFPASMLGGTETVTTGAGGPGGNAVTASTTAGNDGTNGGTSSFGGWLTAPGGAKGIGGPLSGTTTGGAGGTGFTTTLSGGAGGAGTDNGTPGVGTAKVPLEGGLSGAAGGGGAGGTGTGNVGVAGAVGGAITGLAVGGTFGASTPTSGGPGNQWSLSGGSGGGGGGCHGSNPGTRAGGLGGAYGGGGGGGAAGVNAVADSGVGGAGGGGIVVVTTYS